MRDYLSLYITARLKPREDMPFAGKKSAPIDDAALRGPEDIYIDTRTRDIFYITKSYYVFPRHGIDGAFDCQPTIPLIIARYRYRYGRHLSSLRILDSFDIFRR